jgi:tetratricopeptide (TPR) repeat protein
MTSRDDNDAFASIHAAFAGTVQLVLLAGALWCTRPEFLPARHESFRRHLLEALQNRQQDVVDRVRLYRETWPDDVYGLWFAAEAAAQAGDHSSAEAFYLKLPQDGGEWEFQREFGLGRRYFAMGQLAAAERCLRRAIALNPYHLAANERLGHLLQICGRTWESAPCFFTQIQRGKCRGDELLGMANSDRFFRFDERLERMGQEPNSPALPIRLAAARRAIFENRETEAEQILRDVLAEYPELGEAQGRLGRIIVERGDLAEFLQWRGSLPDAARRHPEVLFAEGLKARRLGQIEGAVHCFLKTLQLSPNHLGATVQISACLDQLGEKDVARVFSRRGILLSDVDRNHNIMRGDLDEKMVYATVEMLSELGRHWEAAGWCYLMTKVDDRPEYAQRELFRRLARLNGLSAPIAPQNLPSRWLRLEDFPSPRWPSPGAVTMPSSRNEEQAVAWGFSDEAEQLGISFRYFEGTQEENRLTHIFNTMGGGLGAIDYDADGWVDLYLAQANNWRDKSPQPQWIDRLYRNVVGQRFEDVTFAAGLNETGFSHGIAAGDYDQDGFVDVYVGNLGPNTLYRNNGDGTFTDVTREADVAGEEWSTSAVFADVTADGLPDLYVLNYSLLKETAERECRNSSGEPRACTPDILSAEHDRCYVNLGDGRFRDVSEESGIRVPNGKGLGVIAWTFGDNNRLGLFVANDTTPNFLFVNRGVSSDGVPRFTEEGLAQGVALDQDGNAQASMGVAAGDADGNGRLDLFITNFFADTNTLYLGQEGGFFADLTRTFGLREPSFWMLGFGCQFADFDGDGWDDLIVTNGHVDQTTSRGDPDRMSPQLFRNFQGRRFQEAPRDRLGTFFQGKFLGRGLATLDWNRDGRTDFAVSHLQGPFALVTNSTLSEGKPLVVRLIGRRGAREPLGATVIARAAGRSITRFLSGGDGFLVTNERRLHFAMPHVDEFEQLTVHWPDGHEQSWQNLPAGRQILLIEDRTEPVILQSFGDASAYASAQ